MKRYRLLLGLGVFVAIFFLAATSALAEEEPVHVVQRGENLFRIAVRYNVTVAGLVELNGIENPSLIYVGQRLRIGGTKDLLAENKPIISDEPWWGTVIVVRTPIRPTTDTTRYVSDPKRPGLDTILYAGDTVQVIKTVDGKEVIAGNDKWYKIEAEEEQYVYSAYVKPHKLPELPGVGGVENQEKWVAVYLQEQLAVAYEDGEVVYVALVSTGKIFPTPEGVHRINANWRPAYRRMVGGEEDTPSFFDLPQVRYVSYFTSQGDALHGTYWHHRYGQPMSHGCVNMTNHDAKFFYEWAPGGTPVVVI